MPPGSLVYTGYRETRPAQLLTVAYNEQAYEVKESYAPQLLQNQCTVRWIDVGGLTDTALIETIGNDHGVHYLALEDILDTQQRSKLDEYENGLFFILHHIKLNCEALEMQTEQIALFAGHGFLLTFQEDPDDTFEPIRERVQESIGRARKKGVDYLAYTILDLIIDSYYAVLDDLEAQTLKVEETLHGTSSEHFPKARLFQLKRAVNDFRHRLLPLREAVTRLHRTESDIINDNTRLYLRDLVDHVAQILDGVDNQREMLANVEALFQAEASNRLNHVMRLLTVISTIFIPLTFIVGVYGMNFDNMPELHWQQGYFIVLGVMFGLVLGMVVYFRKKNWI